SVDFTMPLPLQPFLPAHSFPAPAQAPCPLHELMPEQYTSPPAFSSARALTAPERISPAAAPAITIPTVLFMPRSFRLASVDSHGSMYRQRPFDATRVRGGSSDDRQGRTQCRGRLRGRLELARRRGSRRGDERPRHHPLSLRGRKDVGGASAAV